MKRLIGVLVALGMVLASCGGGSDQGQIETTRTESTQTESTQAEPTTDDDKPASTTTVVEAEKTPEAAVQEGKGTATVGDQTWEFELLENDGRSICMTEGAVIVSMFGVDSEGREINLTITTGPGGGDAAVTAGDATIQGERWVADQGVYDQLSGIEGMPDGVGANAQVDGNTISGTGLFYEDRRLNEVRPTGDPYDSGVLEGAFSATCPANQ